MSSLSLPAAPSSGHQATGCATADSIPLSHATKVLAPRSQLVRSKYNVRRKKTDLTELVALIRAQGVLQNLIGYYQYVDGARTGIIEIVAGGRRLAASDVLLGDGGLPVDYRFDVLIVTEEEAIAISISENSGRKEMHPADLFCAMLALADKGWSAEEIGLSFGVGAKAVLRHLKLAGIAPRFITMYRDDQIGYKEMAALAIVDDHTQQENAWDGLPEYQRNAHNLRKVLLQTHVSVSDPVARYVGLKAYEKAGGVVVRDLFSDSNDGYLADAAMLYRMASERLTKVAEKVKKVEGFAWVEPRVVLSSSELYAFEKVQPARCPPNADEAAELGMIEAELDEIHAQLEGSGAGDGQMPSLDERESALLDRRRAIEHGLLRIDPVMLAAAGAIVTLSGDGKVAVHRQLLRPEDSKALKATGKSARTGARIRPVHSERLGRLLTAHRTLALAAETMDQPRVALAMLTLAILPTTMRSHAGGVAKIHALQPAIPDECSGSRADLALEAKRVHLLELIASRPATQSMLAWLVSLPVDTLMELMAFSVAQTVDTVQANDGASTVFDDAAQALHLDVRLWWQATSGNYFSHVSKARIMDVVASELGAPAAVPLEKMKKSQAADAAERLLAAADWLPAVMATEASRHDASDGVVAEGEREGEARPVRAAA